VNQVLFGHPKHKGYGKFLSKRFIHSAFCLGGALLNALSIELLPQLLHFPIKIFLTAIIVLWKSGESCGSKSFDSGLVFSLAGGIVFPPRIVSGGEPKNYLPCLISPHQPSLVAK